MRIRRFRLPESSDAKACVPCEPTRDYLITGIPRSGTSLLSRLLDDQPDSVVINEPNDAIMGVQVDPYHHFLLKFHARLRRDIASGRPIRNKLTDGRVTEDTFGANRSQIYHPTPVTAAFLLGTKDTLQYLSRLDSFRGRLRGFGVLVCIRHPLATIASWKRTFQHLIDADVRTLVQNRVLSTSSRDDANSLEGMKHVADVRVRRALLWRYLAQIITRNRNWITVIRYEDLTANPRETIQAILTVLDPSRERQRVVLEAHINPPQPVIDDAEARIIADICTDEATRYGYVTG